MEKKNPVEEARRYVDNASETLVEKAEFDATLRRYNDRVMTESVWPMRLLTAAL